MDDVRRRELLSEFLRTRRARLLPEQFGFTPSSRRRTAGLRREEVASLANVGVAWYTAIEQGRDVRPSEAILHSLARVFGLSEVERAHLFFLAGQFLAGATGTTLETPPALQAIVDALSPLPAYLLDSNWNYLCWNHAASELFGLAVPAGASLNLVREFFLQPGQRDRYPEWDSVARNIVAEFRADVETRTTSGSLDFVAGLCNESPEFAGFWNQYPILGAQDRRKILMTPDGRAVLYEYTAFRWASQESVRMVVYTRAPLNGGL